MGSVQAFYDDLAEAYHLIFEEWQRSVDRQGDALARVLADRFGLSAGTVLDVAAGIGTQSLGLLARGFEVFATDISTRALSRARTEAERRGFQLPVAAADFRCLPYRAGVAKVVIACDNAIPHLLSHDDIRAALSEMARCVQPGGGVVISMRDYGEPPQPGTIEHRPYGGRTWKGRRYTAGQEWHWHGETYDVVLRIQPVDGSSSDGVEVRTTYLAVPVATVLSIMHDVGLADVARLDDAFYQPLLVGTAR